VSAGIAGTGVAAASVIVIGWCLSLIHVTLPTEVGLALATLIGAGVHYLASTGVVPAPAGTGNSVAFGQATVTDASKSGQAGFAVGDMLGVVSVVGLLGLALSLAGCNVTPQQVQTITSNLACTVQAAANAGTDAFTAAGDSNNAKVTNATSIAAGSLCTGLAVGTPISAPASSVPAVAPTPPQVQTIASSVACAIQAAANAGTAGFQAAGDSSNAQITNATSIAAGSLCTGLAVGTKLAASSQPGQPAPTVPTSPT
jgi:hypothetical protein